jgi:hypothetical protein
MVRASRDDRVRRHSERSRREGRPPPCPPTIVWPVDASGRTTVPVSFYRWGPGPRPFVSTGSRPIDGRGGSPGDVHTRRTRAHAARRSENHHPVGSRGRIESVRTPDGHRRFPLAVVLAFLSDAGFSEDAAKTRRRARYALSHDERGAVNLLGFAMRARRSRRAG